MDASTVDAVADALRALLRDPAFQRLDGSFAAAFEDEHASAAQERFEAYAREVRPLVETKVEMRYLVTSRFMPWQGQLRRGV